MNITLLVIMKGVLTEFYIDKYEDLVVSNQTGLNRDVVIHLDVLKNKYTVIEISKDGE